MPKNPFWARLLKKAQVQDGERCEVRGVPARTPQRRASQQTLQMGFFQRPVRGLVCFDIVRPHRARRSHELPDILLVGDRPRQHLHKRPDVLGKLQGTLFQVVLFRAFSSFEH